MASYSIAIRTKEDIDKELKNIEDKNKVKNFVAYSLYLHELFDRYGEGFITLNDDYDGKLKINLKDGTQEKTDYHTWEDEFCKKHNTDSIKTYVGKAVVNFGQGSAGKNKSEVSVSTAQQELITGVFCKLALDGKNLDKLDKTIFEQWLKKSHIDEPGDKNLQADVLWNIIEKNPAGWTDSFKLVANKFKSKFKNKGLELYFGYGNASSPKGLLGNIYKNASILLKEEGFTAQINKWSPADIWFLDSTGAKIAADIQKSKSIYELNQTLRDAISNQHIIPISLKKCSGSVTVEEYNLLADSKGKSIFPFSADDISNIKFDKLNEKTFYNAAGGNIRFHVAHAKGSKEQSLSARNFNGATAFYIEINGKNAQGGKTNIHVLNGIIKQVTGKKSTLETDYEKIHEFFGVKTVKSGKKKSTELVDHNRDVVKEFYDKVHALPKLALSHKILLEAEEMQSNFLRYTALMEARTAKTPKAPKAEKAIPGFVKLNPSFDHFYEEFKKMDLAWKTSKWLLVEVIYNILTHSSGPDKMKEIIYHLFRLASSRHDVSAPFYKFS